ncbi:lasso peptide biosynthesis B2 protein [Flavisphingomonas formosensis]|uniref:lasso peptide biosynthesis B2 protein n=1 Tax=Flavisphingomonas formosensis TaxID=861534 RepID=UPI0012F8E6F7|nr:lasso peptide biosynthesis B2 protein [Sphingomonas formosensis]
MIVVLRRKLMSLVRLPAFVLAWLLPVWIMMGLAALALRLVPVRRLAPLFGRGIGAVGFVPLLPPARRRRADELRRTIELAARYAPFRSNCFPQALVAQALCRLFRLPFAMHFGVRKARAGEAATAGLAAHAWVVSGPVAISGGNASFLHYGPVGCFISPALWRALAAASAPAQP